MKNIYHVKIVIFQQRILTNASPPLGMNFVMYDCIIYQSDFILQDVRETSLYLPLSLSFLSTFCTYVTLCLSQTYIKFTIFA